MKNKFIHSVVIVVGLALSTQAFAEKLVVDQAHSSINFKVNHLKFSEIPGRFLKFTGTVDFDEKNLKKSKVDFTVETASISTDVEKRDEHLRSADFFDTAKFPQATFKSKSIRKSDDEYVLEGDLTIRGVTKRVTFEVEKLGKVNDPVMKVEKTVFQAEGKINRKDFGVNYGPDEVISDQVELEINLETVPAKK